MRDAFFRTILDVAREREDVLFLTGDLGWRLVDPLRGALGQRFLNMGVAEANMVGAAAGMAAAGKRPFVYSIGPFLAARAFEQIRLDVAYMNLPVVLVGVGGGLDYGPNGPTHHAIEDLAALRALPGLTILAPCDPLETAWAARAVLDLDGPAYLRIGRGRDPVFHASPPPLSIGRAFVHREGNDASILAAGSILGAALEASRLLERDGIRARVVGLPTIKPLDARAVRRCLAETRAVVVVEDHSVYGGLGGAVAEVAAEAAASVPVRRLGIPDRFAPSSGSAEYLRGLYGLTAAKVAEAVRETLAGAGGWGTQAK